MRYAAVELRARVLQEEPEGLVHPRPAPGPRGRVRGGEKKRHAPAKLEEVKAELQAEDCIEVEEILFEEWGKEYLSQIGEEYTPDTVRVYTWKVNRLFVPALKGHYVSEVRRADVERLIASRRGVTAATRNRYLTVLSSMFSRAVAQGYSRKNPCDGVRRRLEEERPVPFLDLAERDRLVRACPPRLRALVRIALGTGMRKGELLALEWRDVDLSRGIICIRKSKAKRPREVPITEDVAEVLSALRESQAVPLAGPDLVLRLPSVTGNNYAGFKRAAAAVGHPELRIHDLRHLFAVTCVRAGVPFPDLAKVMGHSTLAMTMRYANHAPEDSVSRVAAILSRSSRGAIRGASAGAADRSS